MMKMAMAKRTSESEEFSIKFMLTGRPTDDGTSVVVG
jgi:hypothetical protein